VGLATARCRCSGRCSTWKGRYHFSLVEWFSHYYEDVFGDLVYIVDGADSLPRAFEPYLMDNIKLGSQVYAVDQSDTGVEVHYRSGRTSHRITADECIVTAPFAGLRHMEPPALAGGGADLVCLRPSGRQGVSTPEIGVGC
jgi:monoamine oxidase